ncbi:TPA: hypothetical protein DCP77_02060 [Candidatus Collierbacteria bacterium]|uniref:Mannosyl-glycoprotein endo-beta-N-acetylglucosamidase-like domain-containing protein n=1 Tax=Candidatus Collierbacteria bacterium GW2011_GWA2_42_17 TaxID=1618378 RepID=A0A0G0Z0S1_9BACT|nr:MAG: hypothetical protein UU94_C0004G0030 [Candidatus Collierbacteria bacterium GW2011_GWB2_42_12]KKS42359.1 MAG: hypothetical protein UV06_C0015G0002 [Candidatus Collierbacteria bacterium GW2011_GWA2_42_17]KKS62564.1 MAG: hypothetical protein UV29_C0014G0007 [Candidatus Collierbacteria bacterium GW2011_GWD2_42_50]KKS63081.1 MAG: hypothetical protein UV28_C0001G0009 [Candidatus Collierbacteria bacterium GW2011_GWE2_42_48]KKS64236.1 MAG: hypothetical protein UV32_C0020G0009 [Candidatus Collie
MIKKGLILLVVFLGLAEVVFNINSNSLNDTSNDSLSPSFNKGVEREYTLTNFDEPVVFAALPSFDQQIQTSIKTADARPEIIRQYLNKYGSPLEPYSDLIVQLSDQYNFDYRWLVAIAQQESGLCLHIPENSFNCWGWGIYGDKVTRFDNYEDALRRISPQFTKIFLKGDHSKEPSEVMKTYTPPSDGSWAAGVSTFFDDLD